jgi:23S rRNA pseudouridine2605 synthase
MKDKQRVQKLISAAGICSRRDAEKLIIDKKVIINGEIATLGDKATFDDTILVNGQPIVAQDKIYIIINKPVRTITSLRDPEGRTTVVDLINIENYIFPIGRLDYNTTGTLLLTNDGDLTNNLAHPSREIERVYRARIEEVLNPVELSRLNSDKIIINGKISRQEVVQVDTKTYVVKLKQGSYHHVKQLFESINKEVVNLTRIEFAGLSHIGLKRGEWRYLKPKEIKHLKALESKTLENNYGAKVRK